LETYLQTEGFQVVLAANWRQMERLLRETCDLMVLTDASGSQRVGDLPGLRAAGNTVPIVMLTAKGAM